MKNILRLLIILAIYWVALVPFFSNIIENKFFTPLVVIIYLITSIPLSLQFIVLCFLSIFKSKYTLNLAGNIAQGSILLIFVTLYFMNTGSINIVIIKHICIVNLTLILFNLTTIWITNKLTESE
jgi:hypothetical protein